MRKPAASPRRAVGLTTACGLLFAAAAKADCPDADNSVPGCSFDSLEQYQAFHLEDQQGVTAFDPVIGHSAPGSMVGTETDVGEVQVLSNCFPVTADADYRYGGYIKAGTGEVLGNCAVCVILFDNLNCPEPANISGSACHITGIGAGWNRFAGTTDTTSTVEAYIHALCGLMSDGGTVNFDDFFAGSVIFFDGFESVSTSVWSLTVP